MTSKIFNIGGMTVEFEHDAWTPKHFSLKILGREEKNRSQLKHLILRRLEAVCAFTGSFPHEELYLRAEKQPFNTMPLITADYIDSTCQFIAKEYPTVKEFDVYEAKQQEQVEFQDKERGLHEWSAAGKTVNPIVADTLALLRSNGIEISPDLENSVKRKATIGFMERKGATKTP